MPGWGVLELERTCGEELEGGMGLVNAMTLARGF